MAYDEHLAARIRSFLSDQPSLVERKMFGGIGFLVNGNMAISASGQGGILVRVDPKNSATLVASSPAYVAEMGGRLMPGWLRVDDDDLEDDDLERWVQIGAAYAGSLPPKR